MSSNRECTRVIDAICSAEWAILPAALETIITIAQRANDTPEAVLVRQGARLREAMDVQVRDGVAVLPVSGPIFRYANLFTQLSGATSIEMLAQSFNAALRSTEVSAIVLDIDSPGGMVDGISEFAEQVRAGSATKPVIAYVSGTGASAAYWIASAAGEVVIRDTARVGSIGVALRALRDDSDPKTVKIISTQSPLKQATAGNDIGLAQHQAVVDTLAQVFIERVADYRGVSVETVLADFGRGGVLVGADAVKAGMADRLGALETLIAGFAGEKPKRGISMSGTEKTPEAITRESIAANHPDIANAFREEGKALGRAEGAAAELERIKAVHAQSLKGHEALITEMMFDGKTTGPEAAVRIVGLERDAREKQLQARSDDSKVTAAVPAGLPSEPIDVSLLPLDERCKAHWDKDPALRASYGDKFERYLAFERNAAAGKVRVLDKTR